jgi:hypothetical protein
MMKRGWIGLSVLVVLMLATEDTGWAWCGTCQVCVERTMVTIPSDYCGVANNEHGNLCCSEQQIGPATYCNLSGAACYGTTVGGGGSSGGGGGSSCQYVNGWCPAECFNCNGGGVGWPPRV